MSQYNWISIKQSPIKGTRSLKAASDQGPKVMVEKSGKLENEKTPKWQFSLFCSRSLNCGGTKEVSSNV